MIITIEIKYKQKKKPYLLLVKPACIAGLQTIPYKYRHIKPYATITESQNDNVGSLVTKLYLPRVWGKGKGEGNGGEN